MYSKPNITEKVTIVKYRTYGFEAMYENENLIKIIETPYYRKCVDIIINENIRHFFLLIYQAMVLTSLAP